MDFLIFSQFSSPSAEAFEAQYPKAESWRKLEKEDMASKSRIIDR